MRARHFVQDDAHIFCAEEQVVSEAVAFCELLRRVYADLGFTDVRVNFADRPTRRAGDDAAWTLAEESLRAACRAAEFGDPRKPRRRRVLRPQIGIRFARRHRPRMAMRDFANRFCFAGAGSTPNTPPPTARASGR